MGGGSEPGKVSEFRIFGGPQILNLMKSCYEGDLVGGGGGGSGGQPPKVSAHADSTCAETL